MAECYHELGFQSHVLCGEAMRELCVVLTDANASISMSRIMIIVAVKRRACSHEIINGSYCFLLPYLLV